ncbi:MAG: filamentous hemagglutinin family protein [Steroidobacteraceae bacterium]
MGRTLVLVLSALGTAFSVSAAELPIPCAGGACGVNAGSFVTSGAATAVQSGNTLEINQTTPSAVLNWQSFDVSEDGTVNFNQPDSTAVALNRIFQNDPSRIFGAVNANGRIYLVNQNGILFGDGARVNVGGLVASSLAITPEALQQGIARASLDRRPAFVNFVDANGQPLPSGPVEVDAGAEIRTQEGGQAMLFGPQVANRGQISTPGGQAVLAAGDSIFIVPSSDPNLRGLIVEVGEGGMVTNGETANAGRTPEALVGSIVAERGNVTLVGLAVNQLGRVSATTSVSANGSIRLVAQDRAVLSPDGSLVDASQGGLLEIGPSSISEVVLDLASTATTVDLNEQPRSRIELAGSRVNVRRDSLLLATGGDLVLSAQDDPRAPAPDQVSASDSRVNIEARARLDVAGATVDLPMERNVVRAELRGNELRDSPDQRDSVLRGLPVFVDVRQFGTRPDGSVWQGTPLADVSGQIAAVPRGVAERNLAGGNITIRSQGSIVVAPQAQLNIAGGAIRYADGFVNTTRLVSNGVIVDISQADPLRDYQGMVQAGAAVTYSRWGVTETFAGFVGAFDRGRFEAGYVEGKDAGQLILLSPNMVFDGDVDAHVVVGPYQRAATSDLATASGDVLYRRFDEVPRGGALIVGSQSGAPSSNGFPIYFAPDIRLAEGLMLPTMRNADSSAFDPAADLWPVDVTEFRLRPQLLENSGLSEISLYSEGQVTLPEENQLRLPAGARLTIAAADIELAGSVFAQSGRVDLLATPTATRTEGIRLALGPTSIIDVRGQWVNDLRDFAGNGLSPLWIDGGEISLAAVRGDLFLPAGSVLDVSAGARLLPDGRVDGGMAGGIDLVATGVAGIVPSQFVLESELAGYSLARGASLGLTADSVCIGDAACTGGDAALQLSSEFFSTGGFVDFSVGAATDGLRVASDADLRLQALNWELAGDPTRYVTGTDLRSIVRPILLDPALRQPGGLTLTNVGRVAAGSVGRTSFADVPVLRVERGASIVTGALGHIRLSSNSQLFIDGTLSAPAGTISAQLTANLPVDEFIDSQAIWLGPAAQLFAAGTVVFDTPDDLGRQAGTVLNGGVVELAAQRGYVIADQASVIDVSGTTATVDPDEAAGLGAAAGRMVASSAGRIGITAAEGFVLSGTLLAAAGDPDRSSGGEIALAVDANNRRDPRTEDIPQRFVFPTPPRIVRVVADDAPVSIAPGSAIDSARDGVGVIGAQQVARSGASSLSIRAASIESPGGSSVQAAGRIEFLGNLALALDRHLELDAAELTGNGRVDLQAPYLSLGNRDRRLQIANPLLDSNGSGQLTLSGDLIDVFGTSTISGFQEVRLQSTNDLRLSGIQQPIGRSLDGSLETNAQLLTLSARQIYPSTFSRFTVRQVGTSPQTLRIESSGQIPEVPLSAGGRLRLVSDTLEQGGILRAPFGQVELLANSVVLRPGSVTSTSADGALIPFGRTQGGFDWAYGLADNQTLIIGSAEVPEPQQNIRIDAADIDAQVGSIVDIAGGGDMLAQEFVPGVTGTFDILRSDSGYFAVVPAVGSGIAPFDTSEYLGWNHDVGETIHVYDGSGLPAGDYTLLPPAYAVLPGAYLIRPVDGYRDIAPGQSYLQSNGAMIVAGQLQIGGRAQGVDRLTGFEIAPASFAQRIARYDVTAASQFFDARSDRPVLARSPQDSGTLTLQATRSLALSSTLRAAPSSSGRGSIVALASENLALIANGAVAPQGFLPVNVDALGALGAQTLLIGGGVVAGNDGALLTASANNVLVDSGATLVAPEIIVTARQSIELRDGSRLGSAGVLSGSAAGAQGLAAEGDGAFIRIASGQALDFERTGASGVAGDIRVSRGASLGDAGSVMIDGSGQIDLEGALDASQQAYFGGNQLLIGAVPVGDSGFSISQSRLDALAGIDLVLASRSPLSLFGDVSIVADELRIIAPGATLMTPTGRVSVSANAVRLEGSADLNEPVVNEGSGEFSLITEQVRFEGAFGFSGFSLVDLSSANSLYLAADTRWTSSGDVAVSTPVTYAAPGVTAAITATGRLAIQGAGAVPVANPGLGASLALSAASLTLDAAFLLPSGQLRANALDGDLIIGQAALIDVAGRSVRFDAIDIATPGGTVDLRANAGNVSLADGSRVDVSSGGLGARAGRLAVAAPAGSISVSGNLRGFSQNAVTGASVLFDALTLTAIDNLNATLNQGGFAFAREFRQRGPGDLIVGALTDASMTATQSTLTADDGSVVINGTIDASGAARAIVNINASNNVIVNGQIDARTDGSPLSGSAVVLNAASGAIRVSPGGRIEQAADDGVLWLRLSQSSLLGGGLQLNGTVTGARQSTVEAYRAYDLPALAITGTEASTMGNPWFGDANAFVAAAAPLEDSIAARLPGNFRLVPGVELDVAGQLDVASDWDFMPWRFADKVGVLTLRAAGDLNIAGLISDGFDSAGGLSNTVTDTWSFRLVAGADLGSASLDAVQGPGSADGSVNIAPGTLGFGLQPSTQRGVRTGSGFIDISAARDLTLGNRASVVYTAGLASSQGVPLAGLGGRSYPQDGGDIRIDVGRDIIGAPTNQLYSNWLWRAGRTTGFIGIPPSSTGWLPAFDRFEQGVATLAGGNLDVHAGGDIRDLFASVSSVGRQVGGNTPDQNRIEVLGGGILDVAADGDIAGGGYFVALGRGEVLAGASVTDSATTSAAPIFALGDATLSVAARRNLAVQSVLNPTLIPLSRNQPVGTSSFFTTYGDQSAVRLESVGGDIDLRNDVQAIASNASSLTFPTVVGFDQRIALRVYPPSLQAHAFSGDIGVDGSMTLLPAATGTLELLAQRNLRVGGIDTVEIIVSDSDRAAWPTPAQPAGSAFELLRVSASALSTSPFFHATTPTHLVQPDSTGVRRELSPIRLVAQTGNLLFDPDNSQARSLLFASKRAEIYAGGDIIDLTLLGMNVNAGDVTGISAAGDLRYTSGRDQFGQLLTNERQLRLDGPGSMLVTAGGAIDLQASRGIITAGNLQNPALADDGAGIVVLAGVADWRAGIAAFVDYYLDNTTTYDQALLDFLASSTGQIFVSKSAAVTVFRTLPDSSQALFAYQLLFSELRRVGRAAAATGSGNFEDAFRALEMLFPGSNPDVGGGEENAYAGDVNLFFSQIYTLDGGDISLIAPGGAVNVGLATPPAAFGLGKTPEQLGIVAQRNGSISALTFGNFEVNESRVFAADGGDVLVWSTRGDIDAGRGAKTAVSAPPPVITFDQNGNPRLVVSPALAGSGIQTLASTPGRSPGDVDLYAPRGIVNAGDAGIVAGNLTIAATAVLGANNIQVSGTSVGVPVDVGGLGASLSAVSGTSSSAASAGVSSIAGGDAKGRGDAPLAEAALGWLEVFIEGFGSEVCKQDDDDCLERNRKR